MLTTLGWLTLEQRHNILRTIMMYKIVNNLVDVANNNILIPSRLQLRGHTKILQCRVSAFLHSFFPHTYYKAVHVEPNASEFGGN